MKEKRNQRSTRRRYSISNQLTATTRVNLIGVKTLPSESMLDRSTRPTCLTFRRASHVARRNVEGNLLTLPPTGRFGDGGGAYAGEREASSLGAFVCRDFDFNWVNAYT